MFVPYPFNGKGKPVAFFPASMTPAVGLPRLGWSKVVVCAYWYEFKNGKVLACYGLVCVQIKVPAYTLVATNAFNVSFDMFLEAADAWWPSLARFSASHRLGNLKPTSADLSHLSPSFDAYYDPQVLVNMLAHVGQQPLGSDGWFKLRTN